MYLIPQSIIFFTTGTSVSPLFEEPNTENIPLISNTQTVHIKQEKEIGKFPGEVTSKSSYLDYSLPGTVTETVLESNRGIPEPTPEESVLDSSTSTCLSSGSWGELQSFEIDEAIQESNLCSPGPSKCPSTEPDGTEILSVIDEANKASFCLTEGETEDSKDSDQPKFSSPSLLTYTPGPPSSGPSPSNDDMDENDKHSSVSCISPQQCISTPKPDPCTGHVQLPKARISLKTDLLLSNPTGTLQQPDPSFGQQPANLSLSLKTVQKTSPNPFGTVQQHVIPDQHLANLPHAGVISKAGQQPANLPLSSKATQKTLPNPVEQHVSASVPHVGVTLKAGERPATLPLSLNAPQKTSPNPVEQHVSAPVSGQQPANLPYAGMSFNSPISPSYQPPPNANLPEQGIANEGVVLPENLTAVPMQQPTQQNQKDDQGIIYVHS